MGFRPEGVLLSKTEATGHVPVEIGLIEPLGAYDISRPPGGLAINSGSHAEWLRYQGQGQGLGKA